jgi:hypothetical protein
MGEAKRKKLLAETAAAAGINAVVLPTSNIRAAMERCIAVAIDLEKKAPMTKLWWDAHKAKTINVSLGDINNQAPAALDAVFADEIYGTVDISLNPKKLLRLLEGLTAESVRLSAENRSSMMRIDARPDRFAVLMPMPDFTGRVEDED